MSSNASFNKRRCEYFHPGMWSVPTRSISGFFHLISYRPLATSHTLRLQKITENV